MIGQPLPKSATLIVNARSRQGQDQFEQARALIAQAGIILTAAHAVADPANLSPTVRAAIDGGSPMVIVGGGDGTLSGVIKEFVGTDCIFGALPLGTANSFARSAGIPMELEEAVALLASGEARRIDVAEIDGHFFTNSSAIGLSPMVGATIPQALKTYLGRLGYALWVVRCFFALRPFRLVINGERTKRRLWASEVRILNGGFHGGVALSDVAGLETGDLVIQAVVGRNLLNLAWDWYLRLLGMRRRAPDLLELRGERFEIETRPRRRISVDGEILARTPAVARVVPGAVLAALPRAQSVGTDAAAP